MTGPEDAPQPAPGATPPAAPAPREYRAAELAAKAGITTRTLRFYRERRLLPPPRREGRIAWYNDHHLARLRTIGALLERGHTLGGIADLIAAFEHGRDGRGAARLLGLQDTLGGPWAEETPVRLTPEDLAAHFSGPVTAADLAAALELGYLAVDGDQLVHVSRRLLEVSAALVREGIPLSAVLATARDVRAHADAIAELFVTTVRTHLLPDLLGQDDHTADTADTAGGPDTPGGSGDSGRPNRPDGDGRRSASDAVTARLDATLQRLRPLAKQVIDAELSLALERRVSAELAALLGETADDQPTAGGTPNGEAADGTPNGGTTADG